MSTKRLSKEQRRSLERATLEYGKHLDVAAEWLEGRGLDLEFARSKRLGVVIDPIPGHEHLRGTLAIPYLTDAGTVNMTFRCMLPHNCKEVQGDHSKYRYPRNLPTNLFNVQVISWADEWLVTTEGELDSLTWEQIGVPAVGIPGAKKWEPHWPNIFEDFSRVYHATDGDEDGEKLWNRMANEVSTALPIKFPDHEDTNSMYLKYGKDYLLSRIKK